MSTTIANSLCKIDKMQVTQVRLRFPQMVFTLKYNVKVSTHLIHVV
jgi:hypothetical protein